MKIVVLGGTGAMGLVFGARLARNNQVTLLDVNQQAIKEVNAAGVKVTNKDGTIDTVQGVRATDAAGSIGITDLILVFTKCYSTADAISAAKPCIGSGTTVLSLQNGWGNYELIARSVEQSQVMVGVNYVSSTTLANGHARQLGNPIAFIGRIGANADKRVHDIASVLDEAGFKTAVSDSILVEVFKKLALNAATLPTAALLRMEAHKLIENEGTEGVMDDILKELIRVANAKGISLDFDERRSYIHGLLKNAVGARGSMLQDVEGKRKTEIDVINGAVVKMGRETGIPTPVNQTFVNLIKAVEATYSQ